MDQEACLGSRSRLVDLRGLKRWVARNLRVGSRCREVILLEPDYLSAVEYVSKLDVWLKLYDLECGEAGGKN